MPRSRQTFQTALRAIAHPVVVASVAILIVNDHVLKDAYPGWITGKLSDFAGLVVFPILVAAVLGLVGIRPHLAIRASVGITALWFAALKTIPPITAATQAAASVFIGTSRIEVDPWDLIALPMLNVPAYILTSRFVKPSRRVPLRRAAEISIPVSVPAPEPDGAHGLPRSRPPSFTYRPWLAACVLAIPFVPPLGYIYRPFVLAGAAFLAARWTGHASPVSRMLAGFATAIAGWMLTRWLGPAAATFLPALVVLRPPAPAAIWTPTALATVVGLAARHSMSALMGGGGPIRLRDLSLLFGANALVPFLIVGGDQLTMRWLRRRTPATSGHNEMESTTS